MENSGNKVYAHSIQQYDKWKGFLNGSVKKSDMYILAETYINEMYSVFGWLNVKCVDETEIFNEFAKLILPPKA